MVHVTDVQVPLPFRNIHEMDATDDDQGGKGKTLVDLGMNGTKRKQRKRRNGTSNYRNIITAIKLG
jgi:hypothetical protein